MSPSDYVDHNYYRMRQRTLEWAQHARVSLLDIDGLGSKTLRALREAGIETASQLLQADVEELAERLAASNIPPCRHEKRISIIRAWQAAIAKARAEHEASGAS